MGRASLLICMALGVGLAVPVPADARPSCGAVRAGGQVVVKTREAVVFRAADNGGRVYGCHRSRGRGFNLQRHHSIGRPLLAGRYVAYTVHVEEFMEPLITRLEVFDLVTGRVKAGVGADAIRAFVVKRNGSFAWVQGTADDPADPESYAWEVHRISNEDDRGDVLVDSGAVDPDSLMLTTDRRTIAWTNDGARRTAELP